MALIEPPKAGQFSLWWLCPAVPRVPGIAGNQGGGWWSGTHSSVRGTEVKVPGLNLGNVVPEETVISGFLDSLGQLLVLLHTDSCVWSMEDDTRVGADKLFQELHVPEVHVQLVIPTDGAGIPGDFILTNTCLSSPLWGYPTFVVAAVVSPDRARTIAVLVFF